MNLGWLEVSFDVKDVGRSRDFYEKLGFRLVSTTDEGKSVTLQGGDCRVARYQGVLDPAESQLIFWQGDVERYAEALRAAGIPFVRELEVSDAGASPMLRDPDGQLIYLIRMDGVTRDAPPDGSPDLARGRFHLSLPVADIRKTIAFYKLLGFYEDDRSPSDDTMALSNGECRISLYQGHLDPAELQLIFWQGDIDAVADRVSREELGFFREPNRDAAGAAFMLKDPDGRPLFFINMHKYQVADFVS